MLVITEEFDLFCGGNAIYMRTNKSGGPQNVNISLCFSSKLKLKWNSEEIKKSWTQRNVSISLGNIKIFEKSLKIPRGQTEMGESGRQQPVTRVFPAEKWRG